MTRGTQADADMGSNGRAPAAAKKATSGSRSASVATSGADAAAKASLGSAAIGDVVSSTPGRTRLRVKEELRTPEAMERIQSQLSQHEDVQDVSVNPRTGSVVITHDKERHGPEIVHEALKDAEIVGGEVFEVPSDGGEYGELDQRLADLTYQARKFIYERTGLKLRGGYLLPIGIAGVGIAQIMLVGLTIEMLPGPVLLYIAWDIYKRGRKEAPLEASLVAA